MERLDIVFEYTSPELIILLTLHICIGKFNTMKGVREEVGELLVGVY